MSLFVSIKTPSSELAKSSIDEAITFVAKHAALEKRHGRLPEGPSLDITFMLPGRYDIPPFTGMRMGGYTRENDTLYFEAAIPEQILRSTQAPRYVALVLQDMVDNAQQFFEDNKIEFDVGQWRRVVNTLGELNTGATELH